jgi:hypothetical protein
MVTHVLSGCINRRNPSPARQWLAGWLNQRSDATAMCLSIFFFNKKLLIGVLSINS